MFYIMNLTHALLFTIVIKAVFQHCCTWRASAVVKQQAVLFRTPSTDCIACLTGDQASRLCCVVKRASSPRSTIRDLRTELSRRATDHGIESQMWTNHVNKRRKEISSSDMFILSVKHFHYYFDKQQLTNNNNIFILVFKFT